MFPLTSFVFITTFCLLFFCLFVFLITTSSFSFKKFCFCGYGPSYLRSWGGRSLEPRGLRLQWAMIASTAFQPGQQLKILSKKKKKKRVKFYISPLTQGKNVMVITYSLDLVSENPQFSINRYASDTDIECAHFPTEELL